jgi:hypothetical protein
VILSLVDCLEVSAPKATGTDANLCHEGLHGEGHGTPTVRQNEDLVESFADLDTGQEDWLQNVTDGSEVSLNGRIKSSNNILETEVPYNWEVSMAGRILSSRTSSCLPTSLGLTTLTTTTAAGASAPICRGISGISEVTFAKPTFWSTSISSETEHKAMVEGLLPFTVGASKPVLERANGGSSVKLL